MEAWVKPTAVRAEMPVVSQYSGTGRIIFGLRTTEDKKNVTLDFFVGNYSGWLSSGHVIPLNEWTHVAVVRGVRTFDLFANGEKVYSYTYTKDYPAPPAVPPPALSPSMTERIAFFSRPETDGSRTAVPFA